jgi:hypothetical protein
MEARPPKKALQFLRWFCREDYLEEIEGDLTEVFNRQYAKAPRRARWKFTWSVISYFRPEFLKPLKTYYRSIPSALGRMSFNINQVLLPGALVAGLILLVLAMAPVRVNRENSIKKNAIVTAVKQGGLKDIVVSLDGVRGMFYISHITRKDLNVDSLSEMLVNKEVLIYYSKPRFLSYFSPAITTIQITEIRLNDEVIFSEFQ